MIIDFHIHIFPNKIAESAIETLSDRAQIPAYSNGRLDCTIDLLDKAGITYGVLQSIATNAKQNKNVNDFAIACNQHERIIAFGSVHPDADWQYELDRLKDAGIKGIKLHPDYQNFFVDDINIQPIYEYILKNDFILLFHAGLDVGLPNPIHATPERFQNIMGMINGEKVVLAHMGGFSQWDGVQKYILGKDIYLDTSCSATYMQDNLFFEMLNAHTKGKLLFASDLPWNPPKEEVIEIQKLNINPTLKEEIFYKNALALLGMEEK